MSKERFDNCISCSSNKIVILNRYKKGFLVKCKNCSLVFANKVPSAKELDDHYSNYGRNDYLSPITIKRYNELLDKFEKYRNNNNILDIGCGIGYFLEEAKKRGWNVYGTEYTDEAISICEKKGIQLNKGKLNPENYKIKFDVITSFEVIEHINNPVEELNNIKSILRDEGLFYLTTPNFNAINRFYLKEKWNVIVYPEHLTYYTKSTLKKLIQKQGFKTISNKTTGISITRIKTSKEKKEDNTEYISANTEDEKLRGNIENNRILLFGKSCLNWLLTIFGIGDNIKQFNIKKPS